jgi:hypothetical protein
MAPAVFIKDFISLLLLSSISVCQMPFRPNGFWPKDKEPFSIECLFNEKNRADTKYKEIRDKTYFWEVLEGREVLLKGRLCTMLRQYL